MIVPFRSSGAAADQTAPTRLIQVGHVTLTLKQQPGDNTGMPITSAAAPTSTTQPGGGLSDWLIDEDANTQSAHVQWPTQPTTTTASTAGGTTAAVPSCTAPRVPGQPHLANVGLVVWQSGVLLAELLLRRPPYGPWGPHLHVTDLGTGTGLVGIALALAGARVTLTDLPHVLSLTTTNLTANCPPAAPVKVVEYIWGQPVRPLLEQVGGQRPDVITGADLLYDCTQHTALLTSLVALAAPHTLIYLAYRRRSKAEEAWVPAAEAAGFAVEQVPDGVLGEEYQGGSYTVLRMAWREPPAGQPHTQVHVTGGHHPTDASDSEQEELEHKPCAQS